MQITTRSLSRFLDFLERIAAETYPEQPTVCHTEVTHQAFNYLFINFNLPNSTLPDSSAKQLNPPYPPFKKGGF